MRGVYNQIYSEIISLQELLFHRAFMYDDDECEFRISLFNGHLACETQNDISSNHTLEVYIMTKDYDTTATK